MPQDRSQLDPKYRNVLDEFPYQEMPIRKAPAHPKATRIPDHKEELNSPVGVGKAWKPKGRRG